MSEEKGLTRRDLTPDEILQYERETTMPQEDMGRILLFDGYESTPIESIHRESCYICRDPDFSRMGLPLCRKCPACGGHIAADDDVCDNCGMIDRGFWEAVGEGDLDLITKIFSTGYPEYKHKEPIDSEIQAAMTAYEQERMKNQEGT